MAQYSVSIGSRQQTDSVTRYQITVSDGAHSWIVMKRYTEVEVLHRALQYSMPGLPQMPQKSFWRKTFSKGFQNDRQLRIAGLLQAMVAKDPQLTMPQLRQFLQVPNSLTPQSQPGLQVQPPQQAPSAQAYQQGGMPAQAMQQAPSAPPAYGQPAVAQAQAQAVPAYAQPAVAQAAARPVYAQPAPVYAQPPVYAQAVAAPAYGAPVYASPAVAPFGQPVYGAGPVYGMQPPPHHHQHHGMGGMGMPIAAGIGGLGVGVVGGMMMENAFENRHRDVIYEDRGMMGGGMMGGGFGGGFGGSDFREVRTDMFGDREVTEVRTDMFGDRQFTDVRTDMFGNSETRVESVDMFGDVRETIVDRDMFGDVTYVERDDFISDW